LRAYGYFSATRRAVSRHTECLPLVTAGVGWTCTVSNGAALDAIQPLAYDDRPTQRHVNSGPLTHVVPGGDFCDLGGQRADHQQHQCHSPAFSTAISYRIRKAIWDKYAPSGSSHPSQAADCPVLFGVSETQHQTVQPQVREDASTLRDVHARHGLGVKSAWAVQCKCLPERKTAKGRLQPAPQVLQT
jgi:hypothetical protein